MTKLSDRDASEARGVISDYNRRIADGINKQYAARVVVMNEVNAKIREIQESQQR
jgi:hypothetical protein